MGMKVILDIVTNHMGQLFYYDINKNGQPDDYISGGGCDKWDDPADTQQPLPRLLAATNPSCIVKDGQSRRRRTSTSTTRSSTRRGVVQAYTSLGYSGPAPIVFLDDPATNHMPPLPAVFQNPDVFNRTRRHRQLLRSAISSSTATSPAASRTSTPTAAT